MALKGFSVVEDELQENFDMLSEAEHQEDDTRSFELPPFSCDQVKLWFARVEAQFGLHDVNSDEIRYNAVVAHLNQEALSSLEYLLTNPPVKDKYVAIKEALISNFTVSEESGFKKLAGVKLGKRRPSEMLVEISRLGGNKLHPDLVREIWLERLPAQIQMILVCKGDEDNNHLAQLANKMMEIQCNAEIKDDSKEKNKAT